ncbi:MAG: hypothetical protein JW801_07310 [Bacteroidales bacterium]|nr:hypothetical protein [Bacteroidales bacterium]
MDKKPFLVWGIGNKILTNGGIGIRLIEDLAYQFDQNIIDFKTSCGGGFEIVEDMVLDVNFSPLIRIRYEQIKKEISRQISKQIEHCLV